MTEGYRDGTVPFQIPGKDQPGHTYYKIFGNLHGDTPPAVFLHGGPGSGHEYFAAYVDLWTRFKTPLLFYDQIGCGASTHLPETKGDHAFWTIDLFLAELQNLLHHLEIPRKGGSPYDLIGHSWGGMLAAAFAASHPPGLRRLVLIGANSSIPLAREGFKVMMATLPVEHQRAMSEANEKDDFTSPVYAAALLAFERTFICRAPDPYPPPDLVMRYKHQKDDNTVRSSLLGRVGKYNGSISNHSSLPYLHKINVPTLLLKGENDTARDRSTYHFFELIPQVRWLTFPEGSHFLWLDTAELRENGIQAVRNFLQSRYSVNA